MNTLKVVIIGGWKRISQGENNRLQHCYVCAYYLTKNVGTNTRQTVNILCKNMKCIGYKKDFPSKGYCSL